MTDSGTSSFPDLSVLIVDDEAVSRTAVSKLLNNMGVVSIDTATDGADALAKLDAMGRHPDVMLVDIHMPGISGPEFMHALADRDDHGAVVLVSGMEPETLDVAEQLAKMRGINIIDVIAKPVTLAALTKVFAKLG